jgi:RNA polymerase sigma factor (TIGR02999 family)
MATAPDVTELLKAWSGGDQQVLDQLAPLVYGELQRIARRCMRREVPGHTLQPTALVNEAFVRLMKSGQIAWQDRRHSYALSARLMRRILVDAARRHQNQKGGGVQKVTFDERLPAPPTDYDLVRLDEALTSLAALDSRQSQVVELRFFGGLSVDEIAPMLGVSSKTVMRDWKTAKVWLLRAIQKR